VIQERWPDSEEPPMWTNENRARYDRSHLRYPSDLTDDEWKLVVLHSGSDGLGSGGQISSGRSFGSTRTSMLRGVLGFLPMKPAPSSVSTIW